MKALLVADDEKAITNISEVLKSAGYDTIVYKWLLKALDNIEEIAPHLIVVSTGDYPRHWKTLAQYSSIGIGDYKPQIILYTDENFNEEEQKKAEILQVRGTFDSVEVEGLDKLREILKKADDIFSGYLTEAEQAEITVDDLVPNAKKFVEAEVEEIEGPEPEETEEAVEEIEEEAVPIEENKMPVEEESEPVEKTEPEEAEEAVEEIEEDSFDELASKVESTEPLGEVSEDDSFDELSSMVEETTDENTSKTEEQTLDDIQKAEAEAIADDDAANRLEEMANDELAADRLEEITGDEMAADKLEEMAEDDKAADKLEEIIEDEKAADKLEELSENEEPSENDEVPTVTEILSESYDESEATELPGIDELKSLLEENNNEENDIEENISGEDNSEENTSDDNNFDENNFEESENNDIIEETEEISETPEEEAPEEASDSASENQDGENDMSDEQSIEEKLAAIMNANKADQKEKAEALKLDSGSSSVSFVFTNPITLAMVSGVARNYNGLVLEFTPDIPNFIMNLSPGTKIDIASMKIDDKIENVFAEVMSNDAKKLALAIKKIS